MSAISSPRRERAARPISPGWPPRFACCFEGRSEMPRLHESLGQAAPKCAQVMEKLPSRTVEGTNPGPLWAINGISGTPLSFSGL
ncbi:hypothetical protein CUJ84_pRLN2000549 (plasmid) [Rhizobium leguminosarum]|uniref:Uncharacterized protein n=1 Tax=Rhizobium leguminosarum TaxID=384 RepID=A0A2K9ZFR2_RHILE|nr:hypothetical protein CUJ84_pRLN2000549 [Rhizobium leguminosarum]